MKQSEKTFDIIIAFAVAAASVVCLLVFNLHLTNLTEPMSEVVSLFVTICSYTVMLLPCFAAMAVLKNRGTYKLSDFGFDHKFFKPALKNAGFVVGVFAAVLVINLIRGKNIGGEAFGVKHYIFLTLGCLSVGIGEEIMWRGFIQNIFLRHFNANIAVILSAFLFSLMHLPTRIIVDKMPTAELILSIVFLFFIGIVLGLIAKRDKCIYGVCLIHAALDLYYQVLFAS